MGYGYVLRKKYKLDDLTKYGFESLDDLPGFYGKVVKIANDSEIAKYFVEQVEIIYAAEIKKYEPSKYLDDFANEGLIFSEEGKLLNPEKISEDLKAVLMVGDVNDKKRLFCINFGDEAGVFQSFVLDEQQTILDLLKDGLIKKTRIRF